MSEIVKGPSNSHFNNLVHNWHDNGWHFGAGDPEFWQFSDNLLKPGGRLLDIGCGGASSSLFFALHGMEVTGIDTNPLLVQTVNNMSAELASVIPDFKMQALKKNVTEESLPERTFDTVLVSHLVHMPSQGSVYDMLDKASAALKPGGHIWVRAAGKLSSEYQELISSGGFSYFYGPLEFDDNDNVIWRDCGCSGEMRYEPTVYFNPFDLHSYFSNRGLTVIHSQTIPTEGKMNIKFGEDFNPEIDVPRGGMITVMARKPERSDV